ncbi:MAG: glycosyltransferase family 4 protein [Thermoplasmataceae archaeon]
MKIVLYANAFLPNIGGGEYYNYDLANNLALSGKEVYVITNILGQRNESYNFKVIRVDPRILFTLAKTFSIVKSIKPDIVHISGPTPIDYLILPLLKLLHIHVVLTYHADFPSKIGRIYNGFIGLFKFFLDVIIIQTESDSTKLLIRKVPDRKIVKFPFNGIDESRYKVSIPTVPRDIDLIFIGRMDREHVYKGYWNLISIIDILHKKIDTNIKVCIIGGGADYTIFKSKAQSMGLSIDFLQDVTDIQIINLLNRSKCLILPSINNSEGFGRVALEAIFCGAVPIVSKYAGSSEIIKNSGSGIIVDPLDPEKTATQIKDLILDGEMLKELQHKGSELIKNGKLTIAETAKKTVQIYDSVLERQ